MKGECPRLLPPPSNRLTFPASPRDINSTLIEIAENNYFPALGALYDNGTLYTTVVGIRRVGDSTNATAQDIWHMGSNTKAMTATTVALLIEAGLFTWTSNLGDLLGESGLDMDDGYRNVTIEQLTTHTSSISDGHLRDRNETLVRAYELTPAEGRVFLSNHTLSFAPESPQGIYDYANMNYVLLGLIVDTTTGEVFEDVVQSRLWDPLEITTGGWGANPESSTTSIDNPWPHMPNGTNGRDGYAIPLPLGTELVLRDNSPAYTAPGAAHMSLQDYGKWLRFHFDPEVQAKLNASTSFMEKLHEIAPETGPDLYTYGGWIRIDSESGDGYYLTHDGSNTFNYVTAQVNVTERVAAAAVTNVGGAPVRGATWITGTYLVRDNLLQGVIEF